MRAPDPVHYKQDHQRRAIKIKCEVCTVCAWANPKKSDRCIYGGPFEGYNEPELKDGSNGT